ncbi:MULTISPECIES: GDSL-type esterase/lipase family protein [Bacillus]|uniref:Spore gernimation protein n=1 Tax=Bacillus pumilus TaxID=1408 RepID=A0AAE3WQ00_BACPU|nr:MULTISPECIES: GDSL-type esterase/lipase family protein [Bacillus]MCY7619702.1 GDSL-type esterase/lipase family protein [Bacillus pumilus]MDR4251461.1 spore gernimation protein [Bacillus pumilus]PAC81009.1 spore gernimation protein [Bacillus sp. 7788]PRS39396.1 spore gernimation protein [Bacillus sp. NMCC46]QKN76546.1 spore gernimation protein [Bacillus pumilus]
MGRSYVAIGDSLTVGVGARLFGGGFAERYQWMLEKKTQASVELSVFAKSGLTTDQILQLFKRSDVRRAIAPADIITITGCGNDLVQAVQQYEEGEDEKKLLQATLHCQANFSKMIQEIAHIKRGQQPYCVYLMNLYNPFPQIPIAERWLQQYNHQLRLLAANPHVEVVDVYRAFEGHERDYLSIDQFHPNHKGYEAMAKALFQQSWKQL